MKQIFEDFLTNWAKISVAESHRGFYDFLLKSGEYFPVNHAAEADLPAWGRDRILPKQCYQNALWLSGRFDYEYYEGFYFFEGFPIPLDHAFNVRDGRAYCYTSRFCLASHPEAQFWGVRVPMEILAGFVDNYRRYDTPLRYYWTQKLFLKH